MRLGLRLHRRLQLPFRIPRTPRSFHVYHPPSRSERHYTTRSPSELFAYTSGRWLWDEEEQLNLRYKAFDVSRLKATAVEALSARSCTSFAKIGEGSYNKVFRLTLDNGTSAIARIPNPNSGPARLCTSSEVATMEFARDILRLPVPKVYAWSSDPHNDVGAEYILMEEAEGTNLNLIWDTIDVEEKYSLVQDIVSIEKKLLTLSFTGYGSLFYASESIPGCQKMGIRGDVSEELQTKVSERFVLGPVVERDFWEGERATMDIDRGPWKTPGEYASAAARREISWIGRHAIPKSPNDPLYTSASQNSPSTHIALLGRFLDTAPFLLPEDEHLVSARLWHRDMHDGNFFVRNGKITALIDWQGALIGPLFLQARHPRLIRHNGEILLRLPDNYKELEADRQDQLDKQVTSSILLHGYESLTKRLNPILDQLYHLKHGQTRIQPILFSGTTWTDDIIPLRECLIRVERLWHELAPRVECPVHFTEDELKRHTEEGEGWNEVQDFWDSVEGLVDRDGWTSHETYQEASEYFRDLRANAMNSMEGSEKVLFEAQTRWAEK